MTVTEYTRAAIGRTWTEEDAMWVETFFLKLEWLAVQVCEMARREAELAYKEHCPVEVKQ